MAPPPNAMHTRRRRASSSCMTRPKAKPAAITPIHGTIEYSTASCGPSSPPPSEIDPPKYTSCQSQPTLLPLAACARRGANASVTLCRTMTQDA